MSRPKLKTYAYYNFQIPAAEKARQQALAAEREQTLSNLLLSYAQVADLIRQAVTDGGQIQLWGNGGKQVTVEDKGQVVKI